MNIRTYQDADRDDVIALWNDVFAYKTPHNDPAISIARKLTAADELFFVAEITDRDDANSGVVGTVMGGYDGHRGWVYALAVTPSARGCGVGTALMRHLEAQFIRLDCPKINLQVMPDNDEVLTFYQRLGYQVDPRTSMGKRL
jgi:ribosomal protein S18 acetylase RimI-like enzyme